MAVVIALFGAGAVLTYASRADARAVAAQDTVQVLVAQKDILAGTGAEAAQPLVKLSALPTTAVPAGALKDLESAAGQVVAQDVYAGQVLLAANFASKQLAGSIKIPDGKMAMAVQVQDPQRVGSFLLPGSDVAVFDTYDAPATDAKPASIETRLLLPKVKVIAVGPTALATVGGNAQQEVAEGGVVGPAATPTALITVAVDQFQALKLVHATQTGRLYFTLLSETSTTDGTATVDNSNLFD